MLSVKELHLSPSLIKCKRMHMRKRKWKRKRELKCKCKRTHKRKRICKRQRNTKPHWKELHGVMGFRSSEEQLTISLSLCPQI